MARALADRPARVAVLAAAQWLRTPSVPYLVGSIVATALTLGAGAALRRASAWAIGVRRGDGGVRRWPPPSRSARSRGSIATGTRIAPEIEFGAAARLERALLDDGGD